MDREEAITTLEDIKQFGISQWLLNKEEIEAFDMAIEALSAEQKEEELAKDIARRMATIIENEQDMRVILKNASAEPTDLISRAELLDRIKAINSIPWGDDHGNAVKLVWSTEEVKRLIEKAPSADRPSGEWIPCSEKLPEDGQAVIICTDDKRFKNHPVGTCTYEHGRFHTNFHDDISMIAWMPLPKPYCPNCGVKMGSDTK